MASVLDTATRGFVKSLLRRYPLLKKELAALEAERQSIYESLPSSAASWTRGGKPDPARAADASHSSKIQRLWRLEQAWSRTRFYVEAIEDVLAVLDGEKRRFIELHFFCHRPLAVAAHEVAYSERTCKRWVAEALQLLAHRLGL